MRKGHDGRKTGGGNRGKIENKDVFSGHPLTAQTPTAPAIFYIVLSTIFNINPVNKWKQADMKIVTGIAGTPADP